MKTKRLFLAVSVLKLSSTLLAHAQSPTVSNVHAAQRPGTQLVDITYDLTDPDSATLAVLVAISTNGGASYTLPGTAFTGAVGNGITPGVGKQITWNASHDWPGQYSTDVRFKVVANDDNQPPNPDAAKLVWIPPGTFQMGGSADYSDDEEPITQVTISKGFWLRKYEVTQEEYENVVGSNPSWFPDAPQLPVESVSWQNAVDFCAALNSREGSAGRLPDGCRYSLPTEGEWEYACRAGTSTRFSFGDDLDCNTIANYAWYYDESSLETHLVGQKSPNQWGLYDMHGNVWEWCLDWYSVEGYPGGSVTDPAGSTSGTDRVFRGGSFGNYCVSCRSANREYGGPSQSSRFIGFRVALVQFATGVTSESNVATVDTRTSDLVAVVLAWDNSTSGADFQYEVRSNALAMATAAKLLWASNATAAAIVPGVPVIHSQPIPAGASGLSAVISVPAVNFANPPDTATYVLLVLDADNLVTESDEGNNVMAIPLTVFGIDVSTYQGTIDWSQVADAGKKFAFVKATSGINGYDARFINNMGAGTAAGLKMGAYHFSYPGYSAANTGVAEAQHFLSIAGGFIDVGYLRPVLDVEDVEPPNSPVNYPGQQLGRAGLSQWVRDFAGEVRRQTGVDIIIYCTRDYARNSLETSLNAYPYWVVTDDGDPTGMPVNMGIWSTWTIKQYRYGESGGTCPGVSGPCDLDSLNVGLNALIVGAPPLPSLSGSGGGNLQPPSNGQFQFQVSAPRREQVTVQASDDLVSWTDVQTVQIDQGQGIFTDTDVGAHSARFYRAKP